MSGLKRELEKLGFRPSVMLKLEKEWRDWEIREEDYFCDLCDEPLEQCTCAHRCPECYSECRIDDEEKEDTHTIWICNSCADVHISPIEA